MNQAINMHYYFVEKKKIVAMLFEKTLARLIKRQNIYGYSKFINKERYLDVYMDINNVCNLKCTMCSRDSRHKAINMTPEEFEVIGRKCFRYVKKLQISCAWEISISKYAGEILRLLPTFEIPHTSIYTNGNVMKEDFVNSIFESGLTEIIFSIGEANEQTYRKIRYGGNYEMVLNNIQEIARRKIYKQVNIPNIGVNLTCMKSNIEELPDFVRIASKVGIEFIRGRHLILIEGLEMEKESLMDIIDKANDIIKEAHEIAKEENVAFYVPLLSKQISKVTCYKPWADLYIASNGDLTICPRISQYEILGNLLRDDFEEVYYKNEPIKDLRKDFVDENYNEVCRLCIDGLVERKEISQKF